MSHWVWLLLAVSAPAIGQTDAQLRYACKEFILQRLHDPTGAQLDWTKGTVYKQDKAGLHPVRIQGRAKNAYGALRLSTFTCHLRYTAPDHFVPVRIQATE